MLQETVARLNGLSNAPPMVICNEEHRFLVAEQMRQQNLHLSILLMMTVVNRWNLPSKI
jgi:mannose-1-phosphate guanylyltransferase